MERGTMAARNRRREPRVASFIVTGALVGFLVGSVLYAIGDDNGQYSARTALGYLSVLGMLIGALAGAALAALVAGRRP